jgi:hypothetical protein
LDTTMAGLTFVPDRSVRGNGTNTMSPRSYGIE